MTSWCTLKLKTRFHVLYTETKLDLKIQLLFCFLAFDFCRFCVVIRFVHPRHNGQWPRRMFYPRFYPLHLFSRLNSWEKASMTTRELPGTLFTTSLVWRGPWLGNEPGTSRTRCQHSTTRLSRRWYLGSVAKEAITHNINPCHNNPSAGNTHGVLQSIRNITTYFPKSRIPMST